jgi:hypothetical protein
LLNGFADEEKIERGGTSTLCTQGFGVVAVGGWVGFGGPAGTGAGKEKRSEEE